LEVTVNDSTYDPPGEPFVAKNLFRGQGTKPQPIPSFADSRPHLPEPILPDHPHWLEMYWRAWEMAWTNLRRPRAASALPANYLKPAANSHLSLWETAFTVQFGLYGRHAFPFITALDNFYAAQHDDGLIHGLLDAETGRGVLPPFDPNGAAPLVAAWAEWRYFRMSGDDGRLTQVFWPLMAYHRWQQANRAWPNGFYWSTGFSGGLFDAARIPNGAYQHQHWNWLDANLQAAANCLFLGQIALQLGETELAESLSLDRARLHELINGRLWNSELNFYQDTDKDGQFSPAKALIAYWALLDKELVPHDRLPDFLLPLRDEDAFQRPHPVSSLAADSPGYDPEQSGVWSPLNFMLFKGLRSAEQSTLAHKLALRHLEQVNQVYQHTDTFWDYYAAETAAPGPNARPDYIGWTGLTPIAILIEDVIGLHIDWPLRRLTWDRRLPGDSLYGIFDLPIGPDGKVDLLGDRQKIMITTNVPFTLVVRDEEMNLQTAVPVGETTLEL
jgi:hypothetical protein